MALVKSLNAGVSGLNAFQAKMDVIGNNIANVDTVGFKSSTITFAEMMNQNLGREGSGKSAPQLSNQVGLGVRVSSISRNFAQGAMQNTGRTTDLALSGEGFFVINSGGENLLSRAGNFVFNSDGFLVDQSGNNVMGYIADRSGNIIAGGTPETVRIDFENPLPPKQTDLVTLAGNLNANTSKSKVLVAQSGFTANGSSAEGATPINDLSQTLTDLADGDQINFDITLNDGTTTSIAHTFSTGDTLDDMLASFNSALPAGEGELVLVDGSLTLRSSQLGDSQLAINSTSITGTGSINFPGFTVSQEGKTNTETMSTTVYDNLGRAHSLILEFTQSANNEWEYNAKFLDGETITAGQNGTVTFDELGQLTSGDIFSLIFEPGGGAGTTSFDVSLGDSSTGTSFTQYSGQNTAKVTSQDGYRSGLLVDVAIDGDGQVQGIYDNGNSAVLAQIAVAQVQNQNGLDMIGSGLFRATSAAGETFIDTAGNLAGTIINSGGLEGSNVDLAREFTNMITSQRAYQSNARVITTSDEMLNEAVNLKR
jgi:flagellar hook protein FlgE